MSFLDPVAAHSWVEYAYKLARNGTMYGSVGFPRGYLPRNSTDPPFSDTIPQNILPVSGQGFYSGDEILNKYKFEENPEFPMLEAAPGDYIAIMHLENGHTTLPENQPNKPLNRGTIYFYGTTQPKENEKLFDVHLLWNKDGTGGDGRGQLLATRNYDDGQCYQPNSGGIAGERVSEFADLGATLEQELACQSDIKLPEGLEPGSTYTIYWYWDWPDLNREAIDFDATKNGLYPWAGTFMRGEKNPNGFTMDAIAKNESYSSVIDIKIVKESKDSYKVKNEQGGNLQDTAFVEDQNIYSMGIKDQLQSNFQVDVDGGQGNGNTSPSQTAAPSVTTTQGGADGRATTVTVTKSVEPPVSISTVYVTVPAEQMTSPASTPVQPEASTTTVTQVITRSPSASTVTVTSFSTRPASQVAQNPTTEEQQSTLTTTATSFYTRPASEIGGGLSSFLTRVSPAPSSPEVAPTGGPESVVDTPTTTSFPGGQFRETPLPATTEDAAPTQSTDTGGRPVVSPFLRVRGSRVYKDF